MTEVQWFTSLDVFPMLAWLGDRPGNRKLRLFGCACIRQLSDILSFDVQECLKYIEKAGDGLLRWSEAVTRVTKRTSHPALKLREWLPACLLPSSAATAATNAAYLTGAILSNGIASLEAWSGINHRHWDYHPPALLLEYREHQAGTARLVPLLHEIVGNPFRPVAFSSEWRTSTAVAIARGIYESRDFSAMPILADALQDAGCDNDDVLNHCREPSVHVRGCWVVDLVLGKG